MYCLSFVISACMMTVGILSMQRPVCSYLSDILYHMSHVAVERVPQIPRRPLTAGTSPKTPNLTTRPIRALLRCSQLQRTGVYDRHVAAISDVLITRVFV